MGNAEFVKVLEHLVVRIDELCGEYFGPNLYHLVLVVAAALIFPVPYRILIHIVMFQLVYKCESLWLARKAIANGYARTSFIDDIDRLDLAAFERPLIDADAFLPVNTAPTMPAIGGRFGSSA